MYLRMVGEYIPRRLRMFSPNTVYYGKFFSPERIVQTAMLEVFLGTCISFVKYMILKFNPLAHNKKLDTFRLKAFALITDEM